MPMLLPEVLADYRASLNDARLLFGEDNAPKQAESLTRHLRAALTAIATSKRKRTCMASLALQAGVAVYDTVPEELIIPKASPWGLSTALPWHRPQGPTPILTLAEREGVRVLVLTPAPSAAQLIAFGAEYAYYYFADHTLTDSGSTLTEADRWLVILRAQVEAMREVALRNSGKPVTIRGADASSGAARNTTPAALYQQLLAEFNEAA